MGERSEEDVWSRPSLPQSLHFGYTEQLISVRLIEIEVFEMTAVRTVGFAIASSVDYCFEIKLV